MFVSIMSLFVSSTDPTLVLDSREVVVNKSHVMSMGIEVSEELQGSFTYLEMVDGKKYYTNTSFSIIKRMLID